MTMPQGKKFKPTVDVPEYPNYVVITLRFSEPKTGTNKRGRWWLWGVTQNGEEKNLFGRTDQHVEAIRAVGAYEGARIKLSRNGSSDQAEWLAEDAGEGTPEPPVNDDDPFLPAGASPAAKERSAKQAAYGGPPLFESLVAQYETCVKRAVEVCEKELSDWSNEDIRGIASTLFIQARMSGAKIPTE